MCVEVVIARQSMDRELRRGSEGTRNCVGCPSGSMQLEQAHLHGPPRTRTADFCGILILHPLSTEDCAFTSAPLDETHVYGTLESGCTAHHGVLPRPLLLERLGEQ
jgi:hypothetical protein